jgi:hypothetical protein
MKTEFEIIFQGVDIKHIEVEAWISRGWTAFRDPKHWRACVSADRETEWQWFGEDKQEALDWIRSRIPSHVQKVISEEEKAKKQIFEHFDIGEIYVTGCKDQAFVKVDYHHGKNIVTGKTTFIPQNRQGRSFDSKASKALAKEMEHKEMLKK